MAFDSLTEKLQNVFKNLRSKGRLTEDDVKAALREVKMALLEADVNFKVVKNFVMKMFGLEKCLYENQELGMTNLNWNLVEERLYEWRKKSFSLINKL